MAALALSRWQFAITTVYHFFFVPLTLGLSILVAIMETLYVRTGDEVYKRMTKFWGKLFLINFAMGVVTGIVQEFQFGMNWSEYSRFVGDVFGAPLAIEGLLAFFLESTFLGVWIFGWDKLPKAAHAAAIWLVAIGSNLSALWILVANSFMHEPVGYALNPASGRAEMKDFGALLTNPHVWFQFPHVFFAGVTTASFFVLGISAYHLLKHAAKSRSAASATKGKKGGRKGAAAPTYDLFRRSFTLALVAGLIGAPVVGLIGHFQGQYIQKVQPMKIAASEALWETSDPAPFAVVALISQREQRNVWELPIPGVLSLLLYNRFTGQVEGINDLQAQYEQQYGPGDYIPPVALAFWAFRVMVGAGVLMILLVLILLYLSLRKRLDRVSWLLRLLPLAIALPYLATSTGWILTETGRQPWIVYGLMKTQDGFSPNVPVGVRAFSLIALTLLYAALMIADIYLLAKYARQEATAEAE